MTTRVLSGGSLLFPYRKIQCHKQKIQLTNVFLGIYTWRFRAFSKRYLDSPLRAFFELFNQQRWKIQNTSTFPYRMIWDKNSSNSAKAFSNKQWRWCWQMLRRSKDYDFAIFKGAWWKIMDQDLGLLLNYWKFRHEQFKKVCGNPTNVKTSKTDEIRSHWVIE